MWLLILGYAEATTTALRYVGRAKGEDLCLNYIAVIL
jgi:hypothetical protein